MSHYCALDPAVVFWSMLSTGFPALDAVLLGGLHPGRMYLLAARPSMGKSTLALQIACHAAANQGRRVLFLSLEDTEPQLRAKASTMMPLESWDAGILCFETEAFSFQEITDVVQERQKEKGTDLIVLDYFQLVDLEEYRKNFPGNREQEMAILSRSFKRLAKVLNLSVLVLSQVNRGVEARIDKRPMLSDLRESGALADDADAVAFIYRDEHYDRGSEDRGIAEVILRKVRGDGGSYCTVRLGFGGKPPRFSNL